MLWMLFSFFSGCALHSNVGIFENNQPTVQLGMDILPETIYDAFEEEQRQPNYQNVSYSNTNFQYAKPTQFIFHTYKGWGSQSMLVFEDEYTLVGFGSHRSYWFPLPKKFWITSRIGVQWAQLKLEPDQLSVNFLSPYSDFGLTYLLSKTTAISIKGLVQSNLFLISQSNNVNYGFILGISKGIHPLTNR